MRRHRNIHTGIKPFECEVCKRKFALQQNLKKHKKLHLLCSNCNREITHPLDLELEGDLVTMVTQEAQYVCDECGERFGNSKKFLRHFAREHSKDVKCGLCQELESTKPTGVGYACSKCNYVFDHPRQLEDHMESHVYIKREF
jgi:KRAB domain-containing zinc finger protein